MDRPPDSRLTPAIAKDVCTRTGSAAMLEGSIASLGTQFVLGLRATSCATGDVFDNEQEQAARKEDVLGALSRIASRFRTRAGESLGTIRQHSMPLEEATTSSPEALEAYTAAVKASMSAAGAQAQLLFKRAVELDPDFAMAHARLGINYTSSGEWALSRESTIKAYERRARATDRERFFIMTMYDRQVTGNMEREQQTLESWAVAYPRDPNPPGLLGGLAATSTGRYELSIESADRAIALDPDLPPAYVNKAVSSLYLGRVADAEAALRAAADRKLSHRGYLIVPYLIALVRDDEEGMARAAARAKSVPRTLSVEDMLVHVEALARARAGRLEEARRTSRIAVDLALQARQRERAATYEASVAVWEAFYGNAGAARQAAAEALALARGRDVDYAAAFALALAGDIPRARALADGLARTYPEDTSVRVKYLPTLRALFALHGSQPAEALHQLQTATRFDLAVGALGFSAYFSALHSVFVRGDAYAAARRFGEAAADYQTILDHRSIALADPVDAMARLQLARAFVQAGDRAKAKAAYENLLELWKQADPDVPLVKQAKAEYARLR
jgi:tetratricopeptide (TPR) repeat protein